MAATEAPHSPTAAAPSRPGASARGAAAWTGSTGLTAVAVLVAAVGVVEAVAVSSWSLAGTATSLVVVAVLVAAVALGRRAPGVALALAWTALAAHVVLGVPLLLSDLAAAAVLHAAARWGTRGTLGAAAVSAPLAALVASVAVLARRLDVGWLLSLTPDAVAGPLGQLWATGSVWLLAAALPPLAVVAVATASGFALRAADHARSSRASQERAEQVAATATHERDQAAQIAELREQQTRFANDVHDVVGHSLAVILAQAESVAYLPDEDPDAVRAAVASIAATARSSLQDVRAVLSPPRDAAPGGAAAALERLVEGVRRTGRQIDLTTTGRPRPLPPERTTVATRVLQEMLTNAVRHGLREQPVGVRVLWDEDRLTLEVHNAAARPAPPALLRPPADDAAGGRGLPGMRQRLASVGGRLATTSVPAGDGHRWTTTASLPVRGAGER